jgi:hypothetical protein
MTIRVKRTLMIDLGHRAEQNRVRVHSFMGRRQLFVGRKLSLKDQKKNKVQRCFRAANDGSEKS